MNSRTKVSETKTDALDADVQEKNVLTCGIIMPIATMSPDYPESHWTDIRHIIDSAIKRAGFIPRIVSDSEDSTIIHKSIINNIYNDPIIVCDVSNKNANVMFELGMRLAFNKPVVIIKDDKTGYSFDTSNIQHLGYRKDLRHNTVEKFIDDLANKIKATHEAPRQEDYQSFLSHFGKFEIATIENQSIKESEALQTLLEKMIGLERVVSNINSNSKSRGLGLNPNFLRKTLKFNIPKETSIESIKNIIEDIERKYPEAAVEFSDHDGGLRILMTLNVDKDYPNILMNDISNLIEERALPF